MITPEMLLVYVAVCVAFVSLVVTIFSLREQRRSITEKTDAVNRLLSPTKQTTYESIARLFENRKTAFQKYKQELTNTFQEPWLAQLRDIVEYKKRKKGR